MKQVILEVAHLTKHYGGLAAVRDLSFQVAAGQIFGIAGPNGAGKTSLFDVMSGHARATAGTIHFNGREIQHLPAHAICQMGIARTFQIPAVFPTQTVFGNVLLAAEMGHRPRFLSTLTFRHSAIERAHTALDFVRLSQHAGMLAGNVSVFEKKRLMVATALATEPHVMLFDEPVGGLNPTEIDEMIELIRSIRAGGITVILIEHVMRALVSLSDRVMIMNHGEKLYEGSPADIANDAEVVRIYLGTARGVSAAQAGTQGETHA